MSEKTGKSRRLPLIIVGAIAGAVLLACIGCFALGVITTSSPEYEATATARAIAQATEVARPSDTPAPTDTPPPPPTQNVGVVGERRETGGISLTILSVSKANNIGIWTPDSGNVFLVIEVIIENVSRDDETPYNPLFFSVKDSEGFEYNTAIAAPDPSLQSGNLPKGDKVRGFVAFEVRSTASGFIVTYKPLVIFGGYEPIRISLGPSNTPAPTDTPPPPPTQNVGVVGERRETGGISLTILSVSKANNIGIWTPDSGNVFLVIEVIIENVSRDDETPYNRLYFSVKDSEGFEYNTAIAAPDPSLQSGNLPKGDKVRGFVAFEVRSTASGFIVTYKPLVIFGGYEPIRISLGQ